jgi:two-component system, chemotaxis family, sensor kinase CheA
VSTRRDALVGRFRSIALDRTRRVSLALIDLLEERGGPEKLAEVRRELHTLKGEARMLGFEAISDLTHRCEERISDAHAQSPSPAPSTFARVLHAMEAVGRALRGELGGEQEERAALEAALSTEGTLEAAGGLVLAEQAAGATAQADALPSNDGSQVDRGSSGRKTNGSAPRPEPDGSPLRRKDRWVQVNATRVDELCEQIAGFEMEFNSIRERISEFVRDSPQGTSRALRPLVEDFDRAQTKLQDISTGSWALRLVPVTSTLEELVTHAHELAMRLGKRVRGAVHGGDAYVERAVLETLWDPLLHLVRNAIDHGIEEPHERGAKPQQATLSLHAETIGPSVVVSVIDDGRGIDPAKVREAAISRGIITQQRATELNEQELIDLLFVHGFSTRAQANELSGRGIGLDVVRGVVEPLGGSVALTSERGKGTKVALTLPATIGKERILVVKCGPALYGLSSRNVAEVLIAAETERTSVIGGLVLTHQGERLPLRSLAMSLGATLVEREPLILILRQGSLHCAFSVASVLGDYELVRRPADRLAAAAANIQASGVLSDGRTVFLVTVAGLLHRAERVTAAAAPTASPRAAPTERKPKVLVVDDSSVVRELVTDVLRTGGTEPHPVPNGHAALDYLRTQHADVVLLDVDMPEIGGFEVLRQIRLRSQRMPVIMLTTRASEEDRRMASSLGADAYVIKGEFSEETLLDAIHRFVRG